MQLKSSVSTRSHPVLPALAVFPVLAGLLVSLWINFHWYLPDFNLVPGDQGDTRLVVYTLEHWFQVLRGAEPFFRLEMFYPDPKALAYADGLLLLGAPYSAFRLIGLDYFSSYQLVLVLFTAIGYAGWTLLLHRVFKTSGMLAVVGGILLSSLNALQLQADIGKLTAVNLYPVLLYWLWSYLAAGDQRALKATLALIGFSAGLGLLFFTSYYPAWFLLFTLVILAFLGILAGILFSGTQRTLAGIWTALKKRRWQVLLALGSFAVALIPFLISYAPLVAEGSRRGFDLILDFSPTFRDLVNVSAKNIVWSPVWTAIGFPFGNREIQMGSPILVLAIALLTTCNLAGRLRSKGWRQLNQKDQRLFLLAGTAAVLVVLSVRVGGLSLWYMIYRIVPGASALRAAGRILIMVDIIVIILAVCGIQQFVDSWRSAKHRGPTIVPVLFGAACAALIAEQVNWTPFKLEKDQQLGMLARFRAPTETCQAFYVINASPDGLPFGYYQLDAMMIGMHLGIPTVNGYSGFEPHEAFRLTPMGPEYQYRMMDWLLQNRATQGICELDLETGTFRSVDVAEAYAQGQRAYRLELLDKFSALFEAAQHALLDGRSVADLYPEYLEQHGYLDPAFGHQTGARYRWIQDRYWIGQKACGNKQCFAVAVVGAYADLRPILDQYEARAREILFPSPEALDQRSPPAEETRGELLMVFPAAMPQ